MHVLALDTDFNGCMHIVKEVNTNNSIYLANSMNSIGIEGQEPWPSNRAPVRLASAGLDHHPVGNLGNISVQRAEAAQRPGHSQQAATSRGHARQGHAFYLSSLNSFATR